MRAYNFSAGPAVLPESVLEIAKQEMLDWKGSGLSVMEMSHRSKEFGEILNHAMSQVRQVLSISDNYDVLFLQGGASLQFAMVPMNLASKDSVIDIIHTGAWTQKAIDEINRIAKSRIIASSEDLNFSYLPKIDSISMNQDAAYIHLCSNNTIFGTQWKSYPITGDIPLIADMSSDICSKPINVEQFGVIFAGAQKNLGPSGVTLVIIRKDLAERASDALPNMLQYRQHIKANSLYNTPPSFSIYILGLVMDWICENGGLKTIDQKNQDKANLLYQCIDDSDFYQCPVQLKDRSLMNVVFRIQDESLESIFIDEAKKENMSGLKGHRSVGGIRASIYNAQPEKSVEALVQFMQDFQKKHG